VILQFWRHGSNTVLGLLILFAAGMDVSGLWQPHGWLVLLGALLFFLSEYGYHRYAFHAPPFYKIPVLLHLQHRLHYDHHVEPNRLNLLFLPIWFLVPNLAVAAGLFALAFGMQAAAPALLGMMLAILHYEWVHYVAHIPYTPRTRPGRWIKQYHLRHHFISEKHWFGVSNPSLDGAFGTFHGPDSTEKSATTRKLYS
jgi:4-hydroxysphinganine ceramide fatty acyl 2-hydroxylase